MTCGRILDMLPASLLHGIGCNHCRHREGRLITNDGFKKHLKEVVGDEYIPLTEYTGATNKVVFKHKVCGNVFEMRPNNIFNGQRCPHCFGTPKKTDEDFKQEVYDLVGDEYTFLDKYVNARTKLRVRHNECGSIYKVRPDDFIHGCRCPYCNSPKGETVISKVLDTLNLSYETQQTFNDLKDKTYLSYDFYIPDQNILIEYQGIQHYQPVDIFGGETQFKTQQKHDKMKLDYAKNHGYNLILVPYTEDTFYKIKKYLIKHGM